MVYVHVNQEKPPHGQIFKLKRKVKGLRLRRGFNQPVVIYRCWWTPSLCDVHNIQEDCNSGDGGIEMSPLRIRWKPYSQTIRRIKNGNARNNEKTSY
ncbi:hypothetical protein O3M35_013348 [Rhynocoris fuscipes]|uniref:Uncharacterized protein n=1 Tax=Rhynocoris fuscipes TaxID=488301 RepID=A0AAW1CEG4_9HEMI